MTCHKWTTKEQEAWLLERNNAFLAANQRRTAVKEFFPSVMQAFHEKWPVPAVTSEEVMDAGSVEFAVRVKKDKYDKRVSVWYHNYNRSTPAKGDVLDVRRDPAPRRLQPWQAYQKLTYETQWKPEVNRLWTEYKTSHAADHPGKDLPKTRLDIMLTFMKQKYEESSPEMKALCEQHCDPDSQAQGTSNSGQTNDADVNARYQSAIDKLPRTVMNIADSLSKQTGWNITIIAGSPAPANGGSILMYINHSGKTKDGKSFKEFLGGKEYDEHIQYPFERFLRDCYSAEDCDARKLATNDNGDNNTGATEQSEVGNEDKENGNKHTTETSTAGPSLAPSSPAIQSPTPIFKPSQYELEHNQNIEDLAQVLTKLKEDYPPPEGWGVKKNKQKAPRSKKNSEGKEGERPVEKRQSARLRDIGNIDHPSSTTVSTSLIPITQPQEALETNATPTSDAVNADGAAVSNPIVDDGPLAPLASPLQAPALTAVRASESPISSPPSLTKAKKILLDTIHQEPLPNPTSVPSPQADIPQISQPTPQAEIPQISQPIFSLETTAVSAEDQPWWL